MEVDLNYRPRALDLFCGAGGVSQGLYDAGFAVVGVDILPQRHYPFPFIQGDATNPPVDLSAFDFIWASPPCQRWVVGSKFRMKHGANYPDLIDCTRQILKNSKVPFVIENIMRAPIRPDLILHGHMFGLRVIRKRKFEISWPWFKLTPPLPRGLLREGYICVVGAGTPSGVREMGIPNASIGDKRMAMGIDWMSALELSQAIPPAYAEFIGRAALKTINFPR